MDRRKRLPGFGNALMFNLFAASWFGGWYVFVSEFGVVMGMWW